MVDAATISVWVGIGLLVVSVVWLFLSHFQTRKLLQSLVKLVVILKEEREAGGDIERQKLLQRQREQQYRETRDLFKAFGWLWERFGDEDEGEEEEY